MSRSSTLVGWTSLAQLLWLALPARAGDDLDRRFLLLDHVLEAGDCQQALLLSDKFVAEHGDVPDVFMARARSNVCGGDYASAWEDISEYRNAGGDERQASAMDARIIGELVVRLEPAEEADNLRVLWKREGSRGKNAWSPLETMGDGTFCIRFPAGQVDLRVEPSSPHLGPASGQAVVEPAGVTETQIQVPRLPAASLTVGDLDPELAYKLRLPTGTERTIEAGSDVQTGAGDAVWTASWSGLDAQGTLTLEAGTNALPLPRAVEITSPDWDTPQRWLLAHSAEPADVSLQPTVQVGESDTFALTIPQLRPGEVRSVALVHQNVPALHSRAKISLAKKQQDESWIYTAVSGGATVLVTGFGASRLMKALALAEESRSLDDPEDAERYTDLQRYTADYTRVANMCFWSGAVGVGLTATITFRSLYKGRAYRARVAEYEKARTVPWVVEESDSDDVSDR